MKRFALLLRVAVSVVTAASVDQAPALSTADRAFIPIMRRADGDLKKFFIVSRREVSDELDLVLALGSSGTNPGYEWAEWEKDDRLGIFLQDKGNANRVFTLAMEPGPSCLIHLERVTAQDVVIACPGSYDWRVADNQKFVFDVRSKRMLQHYSYPPFGNYVIVPSSHELSFAAGDRQRILAATWDTSTNNFRLLPEAQATPVLEKISIQTGSVASLTYQYQDPVLPIPPITKFGPGQRFELNQRLILETRRGVKREFPLPQSSKRDWRSKRPDEAKDLLPPESREIHEEIGPFQVEKDSLWFGKTFYNGEGMSGVGGFGYFDANSRTYKLYSPPEIWKRSVSALLLEPDALWLGLFSYGEGWAQSGGLLRWDRATEQARQFDLKATTNQISRLEDAYYLATDDGIEILRGDQVERYMIDADSRGKYHVVKCDGGYR